MSSDQVTVLLVEHRDEVFARLAADLVALGVRVERAGNGAEVSRTYGRGNVDLLMINAALPDVSGWLLSRKLRLIDPEVAIWLYTPQASADEVSMANFVMADELIEYDGNLWRLSGEIADRLGTPAEVPLPRLSNRGSHVPAFATA
jgi:DNA-binding NtrC family response regulator